MTNREKYKDTLANMLAGVIAVVDGKPVLCENASCNRCLFRYGCGKDEFIGWLNAEYQDPSVDWSKVPIDTPVLASSDGEGWYRRYYAGTDGKGNPKVYSFGKTSWSAMDEGQIFPKFVRLADPDTLTRQRTKR